MEKARRTRAETDTDTDSDSLSDKERVVISYGDKEIVVTLLSTVGVQA